MEQQTNLPHRSMQWSELRIVGKFTNRNSELLKWRCHINRLMTTTHANKNAHEITYQYMIKNINNHAFLFITSCTVDNIHGCDIVSDPSRLRGVMTPTNKPCHVRYLVPVTSVTQKIAFRQGVERPFDDHIYGG